MRTALGVMFLAFLVAFPSTAVQAQSCSPETCGTSLPPQTPSARSYDDFIIVAYYAAYGRLPTCIERLTEYYALQDAAANSALNAEARRFVATLFMTQASYDANDFTTYTQQAEYESRNPKNDVNRVSLESFVADLYRAFLQREPDSGGQCYWANDACTNQRKHTIRAFEESIEFTDLVDALYPGDEPDCLIVPPHDPPCPGSGGGWGQLCPEV